MQNGKVVKIMQSNKEGMEIDRDRPTDKQSLNWRLKFFVIFLLQSRIKYFLLLLNSLKMMIQ